MGLFWTSRLLFQSNEDEIETQLQKVVSSHCADLGMKLSRILSVILTSYITIRTTTKALLITTNPFPLSMLNGKTRKGESFYFPSKTLVTRSSLLLSIPIVNCQSNQA